MKRIWNGAFTLIELLVVITIIGILATWWVTVFTSQIQKSRDTNRIKDLQVWISSVEQYYWDESSYPDTISTWTVLPYIPSIPSDPKHWQTSAKYGSWATASWSTLDYQYWVFADDMTGVSKQKYEVNCAFENKWNVDNKAGEDKWSDNARFEMWIYWSGWKLNVWSTSSWSWIAN